MNRVFWNVDLVFLEASELEAMVQSNLVAIVCYSDTNTL